MEKVHQVLMNDDLGILNKLSYLYLGDEVWFKLFQYFFFFICLKHNDTYEFKTQLIGEKEF